MFITRKYQVHKSYDDDDDDDDDDNNNMPVSVTARSKASGCGHSPAEIVGSNSTGDMDACL